MHLPCNIFYNSKLLINHAHTANLWPPVLTSYMNSIILASSYIQVQNKYLKTRITWSLYLCLQNVEDTLFLYLLGTKLLDLVIQMQLGVEKLYFRIHVRLQIHSYIFSILKKSFRTNNDARYKKTTKLNNLQKGR